MDVTLTPDTIIYWQYGPFKLNATLVFTWFVMSVLVIGSAAITRNLSKGPDVSRWQLILETVVDTIRSQLKEIVGKDVESYLPFIGTLFLFISASSLLSVLPIYEAPTASLSTTAALATCVFLSVFVYGIANLGLFEYLKTYLEPTPLMLPLNIVTELSRTVALAVRLFGNTMAGSLIIAIIVSLVPFVFPVIFHLLELLVGQVQAYIFAVLAAIFIGASVRGEAS